MDTNLSIQNYVFSKETSREALSDVIKAIFATYCLTRLTFATKRNVVRRDARATLKTSAHSQNVAASSRASGTKAGSLGNIVPSPRPLQLKVNTPLQRLSWTSEKVPKSASRLLSHRQATASPQARPRSASVAMLRGAAARPLTASMCQARAVECNELKEPSTMEITTVGSDIAKRVFQLHGVDAAGKPVLRRKLQRSEVRRSARP